MPRSRVVRCICVVASLGALAALVYALWDRESTGERPIVLARQDDDGSSDLPLRLTPTDPLPPLTAQVVIPYRPPTDLFDAREAIEAVKPVVIDVPSEEPEPVPDPITVTSAGSSARRDSATAAAFLLFAIVMTRRARSRSLRPSPERVPRVAPSPVSVD